MIEQCLKEIEEAIKIINKNIKAILIELNFEKEKNRKLENRLLRILKKRS